MPTDPNKPERELAAGTGPPVPNMGGIPTPMATPPPPPPQGPPVASTTQGRPPGQTPTPQTDTIPPPPPSVTAPVPPGMQQQPQQMPEGPPKQQEAQQQAQALPPPPPALPKIPQDISSYVSEGNTLDVPEGQVTRLDGQINARLSDLGKRQWLATKKRMVEEFGDYPDKDDPEAPQPTIVPGRPSFNPFTGKWVGV